MKFTEDTRVKLPVILPLVRLGYQYLSLREGFVAQIKFVPSLPNQNSFML